MGHAYNDITGDSLRSKVASNAYRDNPIWDKKKPEPVKKPEMFTLTAEQLDDMLVQAYSQGRLLKNMGLAVSKIMNKLRKEQM